MSNFTVLRLNWNHLSIINCSTHYYLIISLSQLSVSLCDTFLEHRSIGLGEEERCHQTGRNGDFYILTVTMST